VKKPSPKIVKLIFKAALKDAKHLESLSNIEISFLSRLGIGELSTYGFSLEDSVKLLVLIWKELFSRN
jgi:hypothetical protein